MEASSKADREHVSQAVYLGQPGQLCAIVLQRLDRVGAWQVQWHRKGGHLYTPSWLRHFLHANVLDVMSRQPLQEHFLLLGEFDDCALLSIQGRDEFKDPIGEPLGTVLGVDPVVIGLQRGYVWLI